MRCVVCNQAETVAGSTSIELECDQMRAVIMNVPTQNCPSCGESYADETVTVRLLRQAEKLIQAGAKVEICEYAGAEDGPPAPPDF